MFTVALIGPDGAGKTTVGRELEHALPLPVKYLYMGVNLDASGLMLPTTRLVLAVKQARGRRPDMVAAPSARSESPRSNGALRRTVVGLKSIVRMMNWLAEEWYRQVVAWSYLRRGYVVVFDRHFFADYYTRDVVGGAGRPATGRIHGWVLQRLYPKPDLTIYLDAPAAVLYGRKGEGSLELLERRRQDYLQLGRVLPHFAVVDAGRSVDETTGDAARLIMEFRRARNGARLE